MSGRLMVARFLLFPGLNGWAVVKLACVVTTSLGFIHPLMCAINCWTVDRLRGTCGSEITSFLSTFITTTAQLQMSVTTM